MRTVGLLVGSSAIYILVACGSAISERSPSPDSDSGAAADVDAIVDAIANPVREASAQPLPPITATEMCDKQTTAGLYAEHAFPGYTATQLAAMETLVTTKVVTIPGYTQSQGFAFVRDGYAAVSCDSAYTSVTFILPQ
jgi:hypothetical protein